ncbi:MAG: hypothetical protein EZS28_027304, partial [Streblomastix strix]
PQKQSETDGKASESQDPSIQRAGTSEAIPFWTRLMLGQNVNNVEAKHLKQQLDATTKLFENYYGKKAAQILPTGEHATKREKELLLRRDDLTQGLEMNARGAPESIGASDAEEEVETEQFAVLVQHSLVAATAALVQGDFQAAQQFILTSHHAARIIASEAQRRREMALINPEFRSALGKEGDAFGVISKESVEKIKELHQIKKLISTPTVEQQTATQTKSIAEHTIQASASSTQIPGTQQTQPIFLVPQYQAPNSYNNQFRQNYRQNRCEGDMEVDEVNSESEASVNEDDNVEDQDSDQ